MKAFCFRWEQQIPAFAYGLHPFRFRPEGDAGLFQDIGFLLDTTGIGQDSFTMIFQQDKIQVTLGIDVSDVAEGEEVVTLLVQDTQGTGVNRKNYLLV